MNRKVSLWMLGAAVALLPLAAWAQDEPPPPPPPPAPVVAPIPPMPPMPAMPPMPELAPIGPGPVGVPPMPALAPLAPIPPIPPLPAAMFDFDFAPVEMAMMFDPQEPPAPPSPPRARDAERDAARQAREAARAPRAHRSDDSDYRRGMSSLDRHDYDRAIDAFNRVLENKGERADGALYWRAYAQNKLGKREDALASIAELQKTFPQSRWLEDAKALSVEIRAASGQPVSPENVTDEEFKLMALQSLMNTEPDRSIPILEKLLKGPSSPRLKERALFVLAQSRSSKARDLLAQIAKGSTNPDVQLKAIQYLGVNGTSENQQLLSDIYRSSNDTIVKREILRAFMVAHNREALLQAARGESNPEVRLEAIRQLGVMGGAAELYPTESTYDGKRAIIQGLMTSGEGAKLLEIAKSEKDPKLRAEAINQLGVMGRSKTGDSLVSLYRQDSDPSVKRSVINALFIQQNAPAMVEIARKETDPAMKKELVSRLSVMHSKEATDYLMEILSK